MSNYFTCKDVKVEASIDAVSGGEDVVLGDEGAATEEVAVDIDTGHPGELVRRRLAATHNPFLGIILTFWPSLGLSVSLLTC